MSWPPSPEAIAWIAGALGVAGIAAAVAGLRGRRSPMAFALLAAFVVLLASAGLLVRSSETAHAWGFGFLAVGATGACVGAAVMVARFTRLSDEAERAQSAAGSARRELDTLEAAKSGLEEQLQSARGRIKELLERVESDEVVEPQRIERYRERISRLHANEEKLRQVIDTSRDGIAMLAQETLRMTQFTPSLVRLTGHDPDALVEMSLVDVLEKGPAEPGIPDLLRIAQERRPLAAKLVCADGTRVAVEITVTPVGEAEDAQLVAVVRDVSESAVLRHDLDALRSDVAEREQRLDDVERSRGEDAGRLLRLEDELHALRTAKDQAVEAVAHDLRVPLTSVRSFAEILLRHEDADPHVQREFLEIIRRESERLTAMIDELLDVRRIGAGADPLVRDDVDLRDVLGETTSALQGLAKERGVTIEGVWQREARIVSGDRDRLRRMLENLLSNAVRFSSEGGSVEILLREGRQPDSTLLGIRDHGPGIAEEDHEIVFERFHRASAGPDLAPGSGLGLSICREIAAAHGASIWPESRVAGGTTLWVEFPAPDDTATVDGDTAQSPEEPATA